MKYFVSEVVKLPEKRKTLGALWEVDLLRICPESLFKSFSSSPSGDLISRYQIFLYTGTHRRAQQVHSEFDIRHYL